MSQSVLTPIVLLTLTLIVAVLLIILEYHRRRKSSWSKSGSASHLIDLSMHPQMANLSLSQYVVESVDCQLGSIVVVLKQQAPQFQVPFVIGSHHRDDSPPSYDQVCPPPPSLSSTASSSKASSLKSHWLI